ncbi:amino acid ABC transporter [Rheinheimera maricola]|uniref:Amino acid ABC transporter n=1 Tax=Rheinheimera maricola TaxID=2793282 RepID=A0ABS7XEI4_9GAMM|nr:amino acid ABC transporter [Rheinheimera maricola]MBZ9613731.1 amino acid ABC transporter [Rheinheimera maricola]
MPAVKLTLYLVLAIFCAAVRTDVLLTNGSQNIAQLVTLRFCYEDKQLLPYYAGNAQQIPDMPGATIEHLRLAATTVGITLQLVRLPWLRCLQQLEDNSVDALVAAYDQDREHYTLYPKRQDGSPDPAKAINQLGLCLAHRYDNSLPDNINHQTNKITVSRPLGYKPIPFPHNTLLVAANSPQHALELVVSGRVDATTVLCELNGIKAKEQHLDQLPVLLLYPALHKSDGYLMLSKDFYRRYPKLSEQLWQSLPETLNKQRYLHYMTLSLD